MTIQEQLYDLLDDLRLHAGPYFSYKYGDSWNETINLVVQEMERLQAIEARTVQYWQQRDACNDWAEMQTAEEILGYRPSKADPE